MYYFTIPTPPSLFCFISFCCHHCFHCTTPFSIRLSVHPCLVTVGCLAVTVRPLLRLSGYSGLSPSSTLSLIQAPFIVFRPRLYRRSFLCVATWQCLPAVAVFDRCCCLEGRCCLAIVWPEPLFGRRSIQPFRQLRLRLLSSHRQPSFPLHRPVVDLASAILGVLSLCPSVVASLSPSGPVHRRQCQFRRFSCRSLFGISVCPVR